VFFRAKDFGTAVGYFAGLGGNWISCSPTLLTVTGVYVLATLLVDVLCYSNDGELPVPQSWPAWLKGLSYATAIALLSFVGESTARPFIYFQF